MTRNLFFIDIIELCMIILKYHWKLKSEHLIISAPLFFTLVQVDFAEVGKSVEEGSVFYFFKT